MKKILLTFTILFLFINSTFTQSVSSYEKSINTGYSVGIGDLKNNISMVSMVNGYRFNNAFFVGIGVGIGHSNTIVKIDNMRLFSVPISIITRDDAILIPVYANIKANLTKDTKITPFLSLNTGYTFDILSSKSPGFMIQPNFGIDFSISEKHSIYFWVGLNLQKFHYNNWDDDNFYSLYLPTTKSEMFSSIDFRIGFKF